MGKAFSRQNKSKNVDAATPYWCLSSFYFFYFALLGVWLPYWALFLDDKGFDAKDIGTLSAVMYATRIVAPNIWAWLADHYKIRMKVIRFGSFFATVCFLGIFFRDDFYWLLLVVCSYSFFWNAILAQYEVVTLSHLKGRYQNYSRIRLWGSVGFIITVVAFGWVFEHLAIHYLPWFIALLLLFIYLSSLTVSDRSHYQQPVATDRLRAILKRPIVLAFLVVVFLMQLSHGPYYTFFSLYLESYGVERQAIGLLWGLGVVAEVIVFIFMHRLLPRFGVRNIMLFSLLLTAVRWYLIAVGVESTPVLILVQCLHAVSFGSFHSVSIEFVRRHFTGTHQGAGQAICSACSFGLGGAMGAYGSGLIWDSAPEMSFILAAIVSLFAMLIVWYWITDDVTIST